MADDVGAVQVIVAACEEWAMGKPSKIGTADILSWWTRTELATDSWLVEDAGQAVAVGWLDRVGALGIAVGGELPTLRGQGIREALAVIAEERATSTGLERLQQTVLMPDPEAEELFLTRGYRDVRRFWDMAIDLESRPIAAPLPPGLELGRVRDDEVRAFHAAMGEAFEDHWEHHSLPFEEWWEMRSQAPDFDLSWWFVVRDGSELAAAVRNEPNRNGGGYVAALGVRRKWRRQGLAKALLLKSFASFWDAGLPRVTLGVDATNPTGATLLYESVGMHSELTSGVFEKSLV